MESTREQRRIFRGGSRTYHTSSIFFPPQVRGDVYVLYAFVRVVDDFVDGVPQDPEGFSSFCTRYRRGAAGDATGDTVIDPFIDLMRRKGFESAWVDAFLHAMELDLTKRTYETLEETLEYIYGSAEVIGLFMSRILDLPEATLPYARMQGRAMQYINFIRDIHEDLGFGRTYLPPLNTGFRLTSQEAVLQDPEGFSAFVSTHLTLYKEWQREAGEGYGFLPKRYLVPIKSASDMYNWTGRTIERDPMVVFRRKVKPSKTRIIAAIARNAAGLGTGFRRSI